MDAFDSDGDWKISKKEFLSFVTPVGGGLTDHANKRPVTRGDTAAVLERNCIFETTCYWTGMPNAFVVTKQKEKKDKEEPGVRWEKRKDGSYRKIVELVERRKRWDILSKFDLLHVKYPGDARSMKKSTKKCQKAALDALDLYKDWRGHDAHHNEDEYSDDDDDSDAGRSMSIGKAKEALMDLLHMSSDNRAALTLKEMMDKGKPPPPPKLWAAEVGYVDSESDGFDDSTDRLLLRWKAQSNSLVAFFSLEMSGPLGSKEHQNNEFKEIFRDPPDADSDPVHSFMVQNPRLLPNTTYSFRLRAFNGFGPGPYVRADFTTQPVAPPTPVLVAAGTNAVNIKWKFGSKTNQMFGALKKVFSKLTGEYDRSVSRVDLLLFLERSHPELLLFLRGTTLSMGNRVSLYDAISSHGDDSIYCNEIERYQELVVDDSKGSALSFTRTKYVIEQCVSQQEEAYEPVWRGRAGEATIKGLTMNSTFRFRVYAINIDGQRGVASEALTVNTLCDTPAQLRLAGGRTPVTMNSAKLTWAELDIEGASRRSGRDFEKMIADWTKSSGAAKDDDGVSVDMVFAQYDRSRSGRIEGADLLNLLQDLGVHSSEERLRDAWQDLDSGGYITFDNFEQWWTSKKVTYVVKRVQLKEDGGREGEVSCYRGDRVGVELGGLLPNTKYEFSIKVVTPNSYSKFSAPLTVLTAPAAVLPPTVVSTSDKEVYLKLAYSEGGGSCFLVEKKLIKVLEKGKAKSGTTRRTAAEGWVELFKGSDNLVKCTGLFPNCLYQFRARGCNADGVAGPFSDVVTVNTRERKLILKPTNAPEVFTIECTRDVVVGDLILFTERLFLKDGKLVNAATGGVSMKMTGGIVTPRLSVGSLASDYSGRGGGGGAEFAGERTVAARVLSRRRAGSTGRKSYIRMECVWSSVNDRKRCGDFVLKAGLVIERLESDIFSFETFRSAWEDEAERA